MPFVVADRFITRRPTEQSHGDSLKARISHALCCCCCCWVEVLAVEGALTVARRSTEKSMDGGESATHATGLLFAMPSLFRSTI
eukprot:COSAG06_NODE_3451_length_5323_cov_4.349732_6_plen_84_part_00